MLSPEVARVLAVVVASTYLLLCIASAVAARRAGLVPRAVERAPRPLSFGWGLFQLALLAYPLAVALRPDLAYAPGVAAAAALLPLQYAGGGLVLLSLVVVAWAAVLLGPVMEAPPGVVEGHRLVTRGPFALVRHPVYVALVLFAAGQALLFVAWPMALATVLGAAAGGRYAILEERAIRDSRALGDAYRAYAARTPRWLPGRRG